MPEYRNTYKYKVLNDDYYIMVKEDIDMAINESITLPQFENRLKKMGYQSNGQYKICRYLPTDVGGYYYLELYSTSEFPVVGNWLSISVTIKGETRMIETGTRVRDTGSGGSNNDTWFYSPTDQCKVCTLTEGESRACDEVDA